MPRKAGQKAVNSKEFCLVWNRLNGDKLAVAKELGIATASAYIRYNSLVKLGVNLTVPPRKAPGPKNSPELIAEINAALASV